jgi:ABC-type phosphate/phosphonate transport system substrate-binding protein
MAPFHSPLRQSRQRGVRLALALTVLLAVPFGMAGGRQAKVDVLRIGTSGTLTAEKDNSKEKGALTTLRDFIKDETGLKNEIERQKDWRELADKMAKGELHVGVFQGYEFAWAKEQHPDLQVLALAINVSRYPVAYAVVRRDSSAKDFDGLQGQSLCLPDTGQRYLRLFVERECQARGKEMNGFFSKVTSQENVEDCLDDVVDGAVQAAVVDRSSLEAYKRRKPGRFEKLKEVAKSQPFPPVVIAYYDKVLDEATRKRFREGLLGAGNKEKGRTMLSLFRLSGFETPPDDFDKALAAARKAYPPPKAETK